MKTLATILATLLLTFTTSFAKNNSGKTDRAHFGAGLSQMNTGTGFGTGYTINANVMKGRKSLEMSVIYSERESKLSGGDFKYKIFLGNIHRIDDVYKVYKPYLQYNLIYQRGKSYAPDLIELGGTTYEFSTKPGVVVSIGHFLAFGNKIRLFGNTYLDSSLGLGYYRGSLDIGTGEGAWEIEGTNTGFTYSIKIGLGYTFN
jgi:hypothetical protein